MHQSLQSQDLISQNQNQSPLGKPRNSHSDPVAWAPAGGTATPIHSLPNELLLIIVHMIIPEHNPMRDLIRLSSVCRRWRITVESAPTLWRSIIYADGLPLIRKALDLSQNVGLDINYNYDYGRMEAVPDDFTNHDNQLSKFFKDIHGSIHRWRSVSIAAESISTAWSYLEATPAPRLETIQIELGESSELLDHFKREIQLFGGPGGLPRLHRLDVCRLRGISLPSMRFSGLKRLQIAHIPDLAFDAFVQVLQESPELEWLCLFYHNDYDWIKMTDIPLQHPPAQLPFLRTVCMEVPPEVSRRVLLALKPTELTTLRVYGWDFDSIRYIFAPGIPYINQLLGAMTTGAREIEVFSDRTETCGVRVNGLELGASMLLADDRSFTETIGREVDWIRTLAGHIAEIPLQLLVDGDSILHPYFLERFGPGMNVSKVLIHSTSEDYDEDSETDEPYGDMDYALECLADPTGARDGGWIVPHLEILEIVGDFGIEQFCLGVIEVIRGRNAAADNGTPGAPKRLREIRCSSALKSGASDASPSQELKQELLQAANGAEVYWHGVQLVAD